MESSLTTESGDGASQEGTGMLLKALQLRSAEDLQSIQDDVAKRTIVILRVTPLAQKSVEDLKTVVEQLYEFATSIGGDIARLGEERIVITPPGVRIWRGSLSG
ncbi:MAG: cell division protein SepF [Thaumarchaeota archaeon]|nr:cell division protein SepF [Nitrososphaerota archaeon]